MKSSLLLAVLSVCAVAYAEETDAFLNVPFLSSVPQIDGDLNDSAWGRATKGNLRQYKGDSLVNPTQYWLGFDAKNLYVAFRCEEKQMSRLVTRYYHPEERDNEIWRDDCVEIFLDPYSTGLSPLYHIVVNAAGVVYDARKGDVAWDAQITAAVKKSDSSWTVEIAIPLADFGVVPQGGEMWRINLAREEKPSGELSCMQTGKGGFADPTRMVPAVFEFHGENKDVRVLSLAAGGKDTVCVQLRNDSLNRRSFEIRVDTSRTGKPNFKTAKSVSVKPGQKKTVSLSYKTDSSTESALLTVRSVQERKLLYRNTFVPLTKGKASRSNRVWQVEDPLYEELFSDAPMGLVNNGAIYWFPEINRSAMRVFAMQYGIPYSYKECYRRLKRYQLRPLVNSFVLTTPSYKMVEHLRQTQTKAILMLSYRSADAPRPVYNGHKSVTPFLVDPVCVKAMKEDLTKTLTAHKDVVWGISVGDEVYPHTARTGVKLFETQRDTYAYIRKANEEIKARYGGGKWGIPLSLSDRNPYRWIAYRRWLNEQLSIIYRDISSEARRIHPDVKLVSDDPHAIHQSYDLSRRKGVFDIATHQIFPSRNPDLPRFGFITKMIADMSGSEEVWPCAHVENYAASFTPQEVLDLLGMAVRNGATGFHYYLIDTTGRRAGKKYMYSDLFGAPDRFQVQMGVLEEMRKMKRLRFPQPDCAMLYSCDSMAAYPDFTPPPLIVPASYTFVGPVAGGSFRFVSDYQIHRDEVDLSKYKVIFIPEMKYEREAVITRLLEYVRKGGVLVVTDPEAFSLSSLGKDLLDARRRLLGCSVEGTIASRYVHSRNGKLPITSRAYKLKCSPSLRVLGKYDDGSPAIVAKAYGKGRSYYFAFNPFTKKSVSMKEWREFYRSFHKTLGLKTDEDIWRFQFPSSIVKTKPLPSGKCLTNNAVVWRQCDEVLSSNAELPGTYSYSRKPGLIGDEGGVRDILFAKGDLTDRRKAITTPTAQLTRRRHNPWVVETDDSGPLGITFDFKADQRVNRVCMFYSGPLKQIRVETSRDGIQWDEKGEVSLAIEDMDDAAVRTVEVLVPDAECRYVRIVSDIFTGKGSLTISEMEIWGP